MLNRAADTIINNIEHITRAWVTELRQAPETEIHNNLFTRQIVDGLKATLAALAESIRRGATPDAGNLAATQVVSSTESPPPPEPPSLADLLDPLVQMERHARHQGEVRQRQGYAIHELWHEYISLRRLIVLTVRDSLRESDRTTVDLVLYVDRLLDDMALHALKTYHENVIADLQHRATRDPLTGLYNAEYFKARLHEEVRRANRQKTCLSLLMMDVDLLKQVNDSFGHISGDLLLQTVAQALRGAIRETDLPCRYGGDEFAVIVPDANHDQARGLVERIELALNEPLLLQLRLFPEVTDNIPAPLAPLPPVSVYPSVSIGIATYPTDSRSAEAMIARADSTMYHVKQKRRDARGG